MLYFPVSRPRVGLSFLKKRKSDPRIKVTHLLALRTRVALEDTFVNAVLYFSRRNLFFLAVRGGTSSRLLA